MKTLAAFVLLLIVISTHGQGVVDFRNGGITFRTVADRNVYGGGLLKGANWVAQLYYIEGANQNDANMVSTGDPVSFRSATSTGAGGVWVTLTPLRVLDGVTVGETATLQVRVWDITKFASFGAAVAGGGEVGASQRFNYTVPATGSPPDAYYMENLRAFLVPEPSSVTVAALGGLAFLGVRMSRRRRIVPAQRG